jgi:hypothetical protein
VAELIEPGEPIEFPEGPLWRAVAVWDGARHVERWGEEHRIETAVVAADEPGAELLVRDSMRRLVVGFGEPDRVEVVAPADYLRE